MEPDAGEICRTQKSGQFKSVAHIAARCYVLVRVDSFCNNVCHPVNDIASSPLFNSQTYLSLESPRMSA